jgi:ABC-type sugar transport system ATPase subunit
VGTLSGGERQTVAISRAVHFGAKVLILDEPTSALGVRQTANVLATIDKVRKHGIAVVFITHNVRHALAVGDRFTVLNRGKTLGTAQRGQITPDELQDLMAGGQEWWRWKARSAARSDGAPVFPQKTGRRGFKPRLFVTGPFLLSLFSICRHQTVTREFVPAQRPPLPSC